jgi:hypothetical protein
MFDDLHFSGWKAAATGREKSVAGGRAGAYARKKSCVFKQLSVPPTAR